MITDSIRPLHPPLSINRSEAFAKTRAKVHAEPFRMVSHDFRSAAWCFFLLNLVAAGATVAIIDRHRYVNAIEIVFAAVIPCIVMAFICDHLSSMFARIARDIETSL